MMKLARVAVAVVAAALIAAPARAYLGPLDPQVRRTQLAEAEQLYARQDVNGLMKLLGEAHLFIKQDVALKLGRLGATQALDDLRECDRQYSRFACASCGEFGVAILLIENTTPHSRKKALLAVATETREEARHAYSVIDAAGRELSRYDGDDTVNALAEINTYGAQYTVLALRCRKLPEADAIAECVAVLESHATPQKAEAAEHLLAEFGKSAETAVLALKARVAKTIKPTDPRFTVPKTIMSRCDNILEQIRQSEVAGDE